MPKWISGGGWDWNCYPLFVDKMPFFLGNPFLHKFLEEWKQFRGKVDFLKAITVLMTVKVKKNINTTGISQGQKQGCFRKNLSINYSQRFWMSKRKWSTCTLSDYSLLQLNYSNKYCGIFFYISTVFLTLQVTKSVHGETKVDINV